MTEASLAVMSTCLDKSVADYIELHHLLAEAQGQREKYLVGARVVLGKAKATTAKAKKVLGEVKAKGVRTDVRNASVEVKVTETKVRALIVEEMINKAKDKASTMKEEVQVAEVLAFKVVMKAVEAFRAREEYCLEVLEVNKDVFRQSFEFMKE